MKLTVVGLASEGTLVYVPDILLLATSSGYLLISLKTSKVLAHSFFGMLLIGLLILSTAISALLNETSMFSGLTSLTRTISPILMFFALKQYFYVQGADGIKAHHRTFALFTVWTVLLILYGFATLPGDTNRGSFWLPTVFGGLHASAYTLTSAAFVAFATWQVVPTLFNRILFISMFVFTLYMLILGWGVRSIALAYVAFHVFVYLNRKGAHTLYIITFGASALVTIFAYFFTFGLVSNDDFIRITSGRTAMYAEKMHFLSSNNFSEWLFGRGFGSDLMISDVWWWAEKGSHNDFLTFLTENGIVFLVVFVLLIVTILKSIPNRYGRVLLAFALITSLISNGYLVRPNAAYGLMLAIFLLGIVHQRCAPIPNTPNKIDSGPQQRSKIIRSNRNHVINVSA